jgi:CxxC motif-containing protein (DUF1111 family)
MVPAADGLSAAIPPGVARAGRDARGGRGSSGGGGVDRLTRRPVAVPVLPLVLALAAGVALGQPAMPDLGDPHLAVIPRTGAEAARIAAVTAPATDFSAPEPFEQNPGGALTTRALTTADAFSQPSANLGPEGELDFRIGNGLFRKLWVQAPASTAGSDGLGPLYNARACQSCHIKDGRGHPPASATDDAVSIFLRVSVPGGAVPPGIPGWHPTSPDPVYGGQLQDFAVNGLPAEYRFTVTWDEEVIPLSGGETATLRRPTHAAADLGFGPLAPGAMLSARVAPQMIGLGLIEAIPAADILAHADPDDADGDGISGRASIVPSVEFGVPMLGRFGWKAGAPTVIEQSAGAFAGDMGLSTPFHPAPWGDCTAAQSACRAAPHGDGDARATEVDAASLALVAFYSRNLAVPARRDIDDPAVLRGKALFHATGCISCHVPKFVTHRLDGDVATDAAQGFQLIWPYSDLLLHDMGPGLADNRPEGLADGQEWRTAPLWGIGLTAQVAGVGTYLHDGRARTLLEAVLWHGGEAQAQRDAVVAMPPADRAALVRFLESL